MSTRSNILATHYLRLMNTLKVASMIVGLKLILVSLNLNKNLNNYMWPEVTILESIGLESALPCCLENFIPDKTLSQLLGYCSPFDVSSMNRSRR